jgi:hypothetical protein
MPRQFLSFPNPPCWGHRQSPPCPCSPCAFPSTGPLYQHVSRFCHYAYWVWLWILPAFQETVCLLSRWMSLPYTSEHEVVRDRLMSRCQFATKKFLKMKTSSYTETANLLNARDPQARPLSRNLTPDQRKTSAISGWTSSSNIKNECILSIEITNELLFISLPTPIENRQGYLSYWKSEIKPISQPPLLTWQSYWYLDSELSENRSG